MSVKPKKTLAQHFLTDKNIARKIVGYIRTDGIEHVIEVGPGMGILTQFISLPRGIDFTAIELDADSVAYLKSEFPGLAQNIIHADFLNYDFPGKPTSVIGNFPYNISSQIFFKILENRHLVLEATGMIQKEVAQRIAAKPGSKTYGILSVLLQAYYNIEYLFSINPTVFKPPPKVMSAVIRLTRNHTVKLDCDEALFFKLVKTAFNQRRKVLHNSLKSFVTQNAGHPLLNKRPEQLNINEFVSLTQHFQVNQ